MHPGNSVTGRAAILLTLLALALLLCLPGAGLADEMCQGSRPMDPRNSDLDVLEINVSPEGITGRIKKGPTEREGGVVPRLIGVSGPLQASRLVVPWTCCQASGRSHDVILTLVETGGTEAAPLVTVQAN